MTRPSFNHTPMDSERTPCKVCASLDRERIVPMLESAALQFGADTQRERHARGMLPEVELTALARTELYRPLERFRRWPRIRHNHVRHDYGCKVRDMTPELQMGNIAFRSVDGGAQLDHDEFETLKAIEAAAEKIQRHPWLTSSAGDCVVEVVTHTAQCELCVGPVVTKHSAKVLVNWCWRVLCREYAL